VNAARGGYADRRSGRGATVVAATVFVVLAAVAFGVGRALAPAPAPANPIVRVAGILVGTERSPAGALAAADAYVAVEQESIEAAPARERQLIAVADAPSYHAADLRSAAAVRAADPSGERFVARGGRALWILGARRLDSYSGSGARVSAWNGDVFWAGGRAHPTQSWGEDLVTLVWQDGRWRVTRDATLSPNGPVVATVPQATAANSSTATFEQTLSGFSSPPYGGGQ
jgi:hypothetical protein